MSIQIELSNIVKSFGEKQVINGFSFCFTPGKTTVISGASGCGKTTLLHIAGELLKPDRGEVIISQKHRRSFVFQEDRLLPWRTALENITFTGVSAHVAQKALESVGLGNEFDSFPAQLSGGMSRRLAIARAIAFNGDAYYIDEPLRGLDKSTAEQVLTVLKEAVKGKTVILVTHNPLEIEELADETVTL